MYLEFNSFNYCVLFTDLEISDFVNHTPGLNMRTPGQLISLTSHLSFGSGGGDSTQHTVSSDACENLLDELMQTSTLLLLLFNMYSDSTVHSDLAMNPCLT